MTSYAVIGGTLWGNRGAEAMVVTTIGRIRDREPDASFLLLSYMAHRDVELVEDGRVRVVAADPLRVAAVHFPAAVLCWLFARVGLRLPDVVLPPSVSALRRCRALLDVTGISFHDGRLAVSVYNVFCLWPAILLGVPVVRLSQAMGPFRQPFNRVAARWALRRSFHTYARGRLTAELVRELDVRAASWSVAADVAFAYEDRDSLTTEHPERVADTLTTLDAARADGQRVVALVPSSLVFKQTRQDGPDYLGLLHGLVRDLQARGRRVLLVPNATSAGEDTLRNNDLAVIEQLRERFVTAPDGVDPDAIVWVDHDLNTAAIRAMLQRCELVVTSRFHAMIAALALGVPTLVVGWSHKYEEVLEMFGVAAHAVDVAHAAAELPALLEQALADTDTTRDHIGAAWPEVLASARAQFDVLDRLPLP